ncbi:MAG: hypothetical protein LIP16_05430 [Clostridium sp.]|nr:hypothetical protein [Clostridium sp.]
MNNTEKELREYIESLLTKPYDCNTVKEWAFGAVDFSCQSGLIDISIRDSIQQDYKLMD